MAYTDTQKAAAVEVIRRHGGLTHDAVDMVREMLNAPTLSKSTIHGWLKSGSENRTEPNLKKEPDLSLANAGPLSAATDGSLEALFEQTIHLYMAQAMKTEVIAATKGFEAVKTAATALDKMRLIRGLPTQIIAVLPDLLSELQEENIDATEFINACIANIRAARMKNADR